MNTFHPLKDDDPILPQKDQRWPAAIPSFSALETTWQPLDPAQIGTVRGQASEGLAPWIEQLSRLRVNARRRTSPDLIEQLRQAQQRPIQYLYCSVLDSNPLTGLQAALAARFPNELIAGFSLLSDLLRPKSSTILLDLQARPNWSGVLHQTAREQRIRVTALPNPYPQADPTLLLYTLFGRKLRPGRLPTEHGVVLVDAAAAIAVGRAAALGEEMTLVPIVVRDYAAERSRFGLTWVGNSVNKVLEQLGLYSISSMRRGDLLRDLPLSGSDLIDDSELLFHINVETQSHNPDPCVRCGWCVDVCPTRVHPATALAAAQENDLELARRAGVDACIECGNCSYVCPSRLPLLITIRRIRQT